MIRYVFSRSSACCNIQHHPLQYLVWSYDIFRCYATVKSWRQWLQMGEVSYCKGHNLSLEEPILFQDSMIVPASAKTSLTQNMIISPSCKDFYPGALALPQVRTCCHKIPEMWKTGPLWGVSFTHLEWSSSHGTIQYHYMDSYKYQVRFKATGPDPIMWGAFPQIGLLVPVSCTLNRLTSLTFF